MRLIHTADWHLCDRLGRVDRTKDLRDRVEQIAGLCDTHAAQVLVIAGDLFSECASLDEMKTSLEHLHKTFASFFERDGTILAVTGNHDREARVELIRQGMRLATPDAGRLFRPGRMYLLNQPFVGTLRTATDEQVQFALLPYPTTVRYGLPTDQFRTKDEENRALNGRVANWLNEDAKERFDPKLPTVLVGHLHVAGAGLSHTLFKITEQDDVVFDTGHLGLNRAQYAALGHIHKPQSLTGLPHVRYAGSLDRLHFDERNDEKEVVLVELGPKGLLHEPQPLPIPATPMHRLTITDPGAELPGLADRVTDRETALVHVTVTHVPGGPTRDAIIRAIRTTFPRHTDVVWTKAEAGDGAGRTGGMTPGADYRDTVRRFLARTDVLPETDPDKKALLALAETFFTAEATS
jgi:DNA repair protein SbcD/Mre11